MQTVEDGLCLRLVSREELMIGVMILKNALLFTIVCGLSGVCIFLGSVLGNSVGKPGLFAGAVIGGIAGVGLAIWLAVRFGLLAPNDFAMTFAGGIIGFIVAAVIAVNNLDGPLIPAASVAILGAGALIGKRVSNKQTAEH